MNEAQRQTMEMALRKIAEFVPNMKEEMIQSAISKLHSFETLNDAVDTLAMKIDSIFGDNKNFEAIRNQCLDILVDIAPEIYQSKEAILNKIDANKKLNITPGNISIEENHTLIKQTLTGLCNKLNELGADYYVVGALSAFIATDTPLFRYHGDIDIMISEKDLDKVRKVLEGTDYEFQDNRLTTDKTYDPVVGHTQGEHEVIANHKDNKFHLGFFLFDRNRDGSVTVKEYYKGKKNGREVPMILERRLPKELVELEYTTQATTYGDTYFRTSTPESIYSKKSYTRQPKDLLDLEALDGHINMRQVELMHQYTTTKRVREAVQRCDPSD